MQNKKKLSQYKWQGVNQFHGPVGGMITASSITNAKIKLQARGIIPQHVVRKSWICHKRLGKSAFKILDFIKPFAVLLKAGIPLNQALKLLANEQNQVSFGSLLQEICHDVESGSSLASALAQYPHFFEPLLCEVVRVGEQSGALVELLKQYIKIREKRLSTTRKIVKALFYPACTAVVAIIVTFILLTFMVPQFEGIFKSFNAELPCLTQSIILLSHNLKLYGRYLIMLVLSVLSGLYYTHKRSPALQHVLDKTLFKLPFIGPLIQKNLLAFFSHTLAITFSSGLPIDKALYCVKGMSNNQVFQSAIDHILQQLKLGSPFHEAMQQSRLFSNKTIQMVAVGEETGKLSQMLTSLGNDYDDEIDEVINFLNGVLEPAIMAILGVVIGSLIIAMYLPIFKLGDAL